MEDAYDQPESSWFALSPLILSIYRFKCLINHWQNKKKKNTCQLLQQFYFVWEVIALTVLTV